MEYIIIIIIIILIVEHSKRDTKDKIEREDKKYKEQLEKKIQQEELEKKKKAEYLESFNAIKFFNPVIETEKIEKQPLKYMPELKILSSIRKTFKDNKNFIAIDVETTGLHAGTDELLEISAVKFEKFQATECMTTLLKPNKLITNETIRINGINNEMVKDAPKVEYIMKSFNNFIKGYNIIGYNIQFDLEFLYKNGMDLFSEKRKFYDVLPIIKRYYKNQFFKPSNYKLDTICEYLQIYRQQNHRASEDAFVTGLLFRDFSNRIVENLNKEV